MRRLSLLLVAALYLTATNAHAQTVSSTSTGGVKSVNSALPDGAGDVTMAVPAPAAVAPLPEPVAGAAGSATTYMRSDARLPRITRAATVVTVTGGTFGVTWATALAAAPAVILTPVATGGQAVTCELTALPTTTAVAGRCWTSQTTLLNLSIVTAGLTVAPNTNSAAGISVQIIAIPPTQ